MFRFSTDAPIAHRIAVLIPMIALIGVETSVVVLIEQTAVGSRRWPRSSASSLRRLRSGP